MKTQQLAHSFICAAVLATLAASPVLARPTAPTATTSKATVTQPETRLEGAFTTFAGSQINAQSLVDGLRNGSSITLAGTSPSTFQPATGTMGWGNVKIALSLAEATLTKAGITNPTPAQIAAALNGGTVVTANGTSITLTGVLADRAAGQGWGQIAKSSGFKLGEVLRSPKAAGSASANAGVHGKADKAKAADDQADAPDLANESDHSSKPAHVARLDRPDRPAKPDRPERPDHASRPGR